MTIVPATSAAASGRTRRVRGIESPSRTSERSVRVLQRHPEALEQVDENNHLQETGQRLHSVGSGPLASVRWLRSVGSGPPQPRFSTRIGSEAPAGMTRALRSTVLSFLILSCSRISP